MTKFQMPEAVYFQKDSVVHFHQLAVKIEMDAVSNEQYFSWLDRVSEQIGSIVEGAQIAEKPSARVSPPLNTAIYYDTGNYAILPTGALLRTSCNKITHAFCAFKMAEDETSVRNDHRYVFEGEEKRAIQEAPASEESVRIVTNLLARTDIVHPGTHLRAATGIEPRDLFPAICLEDLRYTFFTWLDGKDALRCSIDRFQVSDLRVAEMDRVRRPLSEVELAIYPRISSEVAADRRVIDLMEALRDSLTSQFGVSVTKAIKYQRAADALGIPPK